MPQEYRCPSCGAPLEVENRFSKLLICGYCGQTSLVTSSGLDPTGEKAELTDIDSIFAVGKTGVIKGRPFKVLGQLRYSYPGGFWDEWFLAMNDGKRLWLQEDEGELTAFEKESLTGAVPRFEDISVGSIVNVNGKPVFVTEKNRATITGGRGEVSFNMRPGEKLSCVDGNCEGRLVSLEYSPEEINLSLGEELPYSDVTLDKDTNDA